MSRTATASPLRHSFSAGDSLFVLSKGPRRLETLSLVSVLHANDLEEEAPRSQETTLLVSPEENLRLLARAFDGSDDPITLDTPSPAVPSVLPSTRAARAAKARTRLVVLGIWGTAALLLALLAFFATSS